jgi:arrestin-related trafficking adapter 3/6
MRYRPMTTFTRNPQLANDGEHKQDPVYLYPDQLVPRSWRKARGSDFRSFYLNSSAADLAELWGKLSDRPKEGAKRLFRLRTSTTSRQPENTMSLDVARPGRSRPHSEIFVGGDEERVAQFMAAQMLENNSSNSLMVGGSSRPMSRDRSNSDDSNIMSLGMPTLRNERVVASGNGITVSIALAEPVLFLPGYDHSDPSTKKSTILRGHLHIKTTKAVKIKKVSICFRGQAQTDWPDGRFSELDIS